MKKCCNYKYRCILTNEQEIEKFVYLVDFKEEKEQEVILICGEHRIDDIVVYTWCVHDSPITN